MLGFLRKNGDWKGCCGIYFTSIPLFVPLVLSFLEEFHLMLFNSADFWFVIQKFEIFRDAFVYGFLYSGVSSLALIRICILREGPLILLLYLYYY